MKSYSLTLLSLTAASLIVSCNKGIEPTIDKSCPDKGPVILNATPAAVKGEILVKVKESAATKSIIEDDYPEMERVVEEAGAIKYERLFTPDPRFEARTRAEGLDRWFIINFDEGISPDIMAETLGAMDDFEVVECSLPLKADVVEPLPGPYGHAAAQQTNTPANSSTAVSPFNDPYVNQMRQWDFNNSGSVGGVVTTAGADCNVWHAWELCTGSPDVIVGVFDQGVKYDHEDLADNMWVNKNEIPGNGIDDDNNGYIDDIYGWNFVDNTGTITFSNEKSHGTHVAGTISAVNNNGIGICGIAGGSGKNDGVKIMTLQILGASENGSSGAGTSGKIRAMKYAADNGAVLSSNSWGYNTGSISLETWKFGVYSSYTDAIKYFIKYAGMGPDGTQTGPMAGGMVICSAGNDATADLLHYPSCDPNVIAVAATDMNGAPAYYSNYAQWVTLSAPGGDVKVDSHYGGIYSTCVPDESGNQKYAYAQGTSMATPHVTGALALAISYWWGSEHNKGLTPAMLYSALISSTKNINEFCPAAYKGKMGIGGLDTYNLLRTVKMQGVTIPDVSVTPGGSATVQLDKYFINTSAFSCTVTAPSVASASVSRGVLTVKGLAPGTTTITVADAKSLSKTITVKVSQ